jgi:uncharacterized protein
VPELRILRRLRDVSGSAWDGLHDQRNPFVTHAFLHGLEANGCLREGWGWTPAHAALYDGERLIAAAPGYRKDNSHGEFVFDHAWAAAYHRYGRDYYPKWLFGVPYSPVTGPRLMARDAGARDALVRAIVTATGSSGLSSAHFNFLDAEQADALDPLDWLARCDVQFHWRNDAGWRDPQDFLDALVHKRRKAIRQEREKVERLGIGFRHVDGHSATEADLVRMHGFYCSTFDEKGNSPALTVEFFRHLARHSPDALLIVFAERAGATIAGALFLRGADTLYGRYWGSSENVPGLHFETCYYQGIDFCLRHGINNFEPGAQGEHKLARGFLPRITHSRHHIVDREFARAIAPWCAEERAATLRYRDTLQHHSPFRDESTASAPAP